MKIARIKVPQATLRTAHAVLMLLALALLTLPTGCGNRTQQRYARIDSLLYLDNVEAALNELKALRAPVADKADIAYYTLLKTETMTRNGIAITNDSIDYSIFYYEQHGPADKLARSYYYKGIAAFDRNNDAKTAIVLLKKAETAANGLKDDIVQHKIYAGICYLNLVNKDYALALKYAEKAELLARKTGRKPWMAYCTTYKANAYSGLAMPDSNITYLLKALNYYNYLSQDDQAYLLSNISDYYGQRGDSAKMEHYVQLAFKSHPNIFTSAILADLYVNRGQYDKAYQLLQQPLKSKDIYTKDKALSVMYKLKKKTGDYRGAAAIADSLLAFYNHMEAKRQKNNILEVQELYDREYRERQTQDMRLIYGGLLAMLAVVAIAVLAYHQYKIRRTRRELLTKHQLLDEYSQRLEQVTSSYMESGKKLKDLQQKVENLKDEQVMGLANGKKIFEDLLNGKNTLHWSSKDFEDVVEYFKLIDPEYIARLDADYHDLSAKQYLYLYLTEQLHKTEDQIGQALAIRLSSVRSIKSRIKTKHK